jgi:uncharacterized protein (TIGR00369 family)
MSDDNGNKQQQANDIFSRFTDSGLKIPPPIFQLLEGEVLEVTDTSMTTRYPVKPDYQNPFGYMQGGILAAVIDNTIGPLSFLIAPPSVTTHFNISYVRPVGEDQSFITVKGKLTHKTRRQLFMEAEVFNESDKLICFAHAIHNIL